VKVKSTFLGGQLSLEEKSELFTDSFFYFFALLRREQFFFAFGTSKCLHIVQYYAVNFKVKLDFNVFNTARRTK